MAALRNNTRNNLIAGVFLLFCLVSAIAISIILSDADSFLYQFKRYSIRVGLMQGAAGLEVGSDVTLGGRSVGNVASIEIAKDDGANPAMPTGIMVDVNIKSDISLYRNAKVVLRQPLLGTASELDIIDIGDPADLELAAGEDPILQPGGVLELSTAPPAFLAQLGVGPEEVENLIEVVPKITSFIERGDSILTKVEADIDEDLALIKETLEDARDMARQFNKSTPGWIDDVDGVLAKADAAADEFIELERSAQDTVDEMGELIADGRDILRENREQIDGTMENVYAFSDKLLEVDIEAINRAVQDGGGAAQQVAKLADRVDAFLARESSKVSHVLNNAALASDQFKLATVEIRRAPWRLLYNPTKEKLERETIYDAASAYALAVGDLRVASESLREVAQREPASAEIHEGEVREVMEYLQKAFEEYQEAEQAFLEQLISK